VSTATTLAARPRARGIRLPQGWPLYAMFVLFPIWWVLGLGAFIWPILAFPMAVSLVSGRRVVAPKGFGIWLLFLLWMVGSATQLDEATRWLPFLYRASLYVSASIVFLYVYNSSERELPAGKVLYALSLFWAMTVVGGYLAIVFPYGSFPTLVEKLMPQSFLHNDWVFQLVHPAFAQVHDFLGYPVPRPTAPFIYTNEWGANMGLLTPFVLASWAYVRRSWWRPFTAIMLALAIVPMVVSLNRGLWLSLGLGLLYAIGRFAIKGHVRALGGFLIFFVVIGMTVAFTPLRGLIADRLQTGHSNEARLELAAEAGQGVLESPWLGFGSPRPSAENPNLPSVGTQGQLWLVLFSHGIPGALLYVAWFALAFWTTRRGGSRARFWVHVSLLILLLQLPWYGMLPSQIHVVMAAAALAWREQRGPIAAPVRAQAFARAVA
jgi:hypothetical protein